MRKICTVIIFVCVTLGLILGLTACDKNSYKPDISDEVRKAFTGMFKESLIIKAYSAYGESSIEYSKLRKEYKFEKTVQSIFDGVIWHREEELDDARISELEEANWGGGYYSFRTDKEEWLLVMDSNLVLHTVDGATEYFSLWDDKGNAVKPEAVIMEYDYIRTYGLPFDIEEEFIRILKRDLKIEYKSEYGSATVSFDEMFADAEKLRVLLGDENHTYDADGYFKRHFPRPSLFGCAKWYLEDISTAAILNKKEELEEGEYFRLWVVDSEVWLISRKWNEAVYYNNGNYIYYTVPDNEEIMRYADYFKSDFDHMVIDGINSGRAIRISEAEGKLTDEALGEMVFEAYRRFFVETLPDNRYGASDMKMLSFYIYDDTDMAGRKITDSYKVFFIGYAMMANEPEAYGDFYSYGTGDLEGWLLMGYDFYLRKIDGTWYFIGVGIG